MGQTGSTTSAVAAVAWATGQLVGSFLYTRPCPPCQVTVNCDEPTVEVAGERVTRSGLEIWGVIVLFLTAALIWAGFKYAQPVHIVKTVRVSDGDSSDSDSSDIQRARALADSFSPEA